MTAGLCSGFHSCELKRDDFTIEHGYHPTHRTYEALSLPFTPIHALRPIERSDFVRQTPGKHFCCRQSLSLDCRRKVLAFGIRDLLQLIDFDADLLRKRLLRGCRLAFLVSDLRGRPQYLLFRIRLCG